ncbi:MAG TPA: hypothetical protein VM529_11975 [Gemmata sp.]|nr:hypothetical protein [Gemmata sp.]
MAHRSLRLAAARYALTVATTEELVEAADRALTDGVYSYSLGELGTFRNPTWWGVNPLFLASLEELAIPMPSWHDALRTAIGVHAGAIAEGSVESSDGVSELYHLHHSLWVGDRLKGQEEESLASLASFANYHWSFDYARESALLLEQGIAPYVSDTIASLDREVVQFARDWCRASWGPEFDPAWRTPTAVALARQMYESQEYGAMLILADALQDAGCENADALDHCRGPGPHARGCWVVDLVLGKE